MSENTFFMAKKTPEMGNARRKKSKKNTGQSKRELGMLY